jgi:hypothetical protein
MLLLMLIIGTASVFASGVLFNIFLTQKTRSDLFTSIVSLSTGVFIFISMIGAIIE